jgi:hypothetical protein
VAPFNGTAAMHEHLRDRITRKLDALSDERGYQVLDFIEFLEAKYTDQQRQAQGVLTRFAEAVEDRMRAGRVSTATIAETMNLMNRAMRVLDGVTTAGKNVANDIASTAARAAESWGPTGVPPTREQPAPPPTGSAGSPPSASAAQSSAAPPPSQAPSSPPPRPSADQGGPPPVTAAEQHLPTAGMDPTPPPPPHMPNSTEESR